MGMTTDNVCKCGHINCICVENLKQAKLKDKNNADLFALYYECEKCKQKNIVQVDNNYTIHLKTELMQMLRRKMVLKEELSSKDKKRYDKLNKMLYTNRKKLLERFEKENLYDKNRILFS